MVRRMVAYRSGAYRSGAYRSGAYRSGAYRSGADRSATALLALLVAVSAWVVPSASGKHYAHCNHNELSSG